MASKGKKSQGRADNSSNSEFIQRFKTSPFLFGGTLFVLVIVIIAFVLVPAIVPGSREAPDFTFGYYDKIPISYVPGNYLARYYEWISQYYRNMSEGYNMFIEQRIWRDSFEAAAFRVAVLQEIKKSGYSVSDFTVDKEVAQQFMENGRFSSALYNRYDKNERLAMWRRTQDDIAVRKYHEDMEGLLKPSQAPQFFGKMTSVRRSFDFVSFSVDAYPDSGIISYANEHADIFRQIHLSRITIMSSEREARQILNSIKDGSTTFEDAAKAHSQDFYSERGGDMGIKPIHELYQDIPGEAERQLVIALGKDELSEVMKIDNGWAIFRAEEELQPVDVSDAATLERVRSYVQTFERGLMEDLAFEEANKFITVVNEKGFEAALLENDLIKQSFGPVSINYGDVDLFDSLAASSIPELSGSSSDENFWKTAFGTEINTPSEPFVQGGNVLVLFPTSEQEADEDAIEAIQTAYTGHWLDNAADQSMRLHFLNSNRMEDRFMETFMRYLVPQGE